MLSKIKKTNNKGFTIIEVMIVLAVAALILLIVLLAVPALQRNSRNTTVKNDASAIAGGVNTFESDNNGVTPNSVTSAAGVVTIANDATNCPASLASTDTKETINVNGSTKVSCITSIPTAQVPASSVQVWPGEACSASYDGTTALPNTLTSDFSTSARGLAILYSIETTNGLSNECVSS